jgi:two-component system LytT family response regulator
MQASIPQTETNCILVPTDRGMQVIDVESIIRIQSISNYSKLIFKNGRSLVVAKVLRWFEERLSMYNFLRIHRAHLVNGRCMRGFNKAQCIEVELTNGEKLKVARRKRNGFLQVVEGMGV